MTPAGTVNVCRCPTQSNCHDIGPALAERGGSALAELALAISNTDAISAIEISLLM